jgi:hypothetical protein
MVELPDIPEEVPLPVALVVPEESVSQKQEVDALSAAPMKPPIDRVVLSVPITMLLALPVE